MATFHTPQMLKRPVPDFTVFGSDSKRARSGSDYAAALRHDEVNVKRRELFNQKTLGSLKRHEVKNMARRYPAPSLAVGLHAGNARLYPVSHNPFEWGHPGQAYRTPGNRISSSASSDAHQHMPDHRINGMGEELSGYSVASPFELIPTGDGSSTILDALRECRTKRDTVLLPDVAYTGPDQRTGSVVTSMLTSVPPSARIPAPKVTLDALVESITDALGQMPTVEFVEYEKLLQEERDIEEQIKKMQQEEEERKRLPDIVQIDEPPVSIDNDTNFPLLSSTHLKMIRQFFATPPNIPIVKVDRHELTIHDVSTLMKKQWLNDEVINVYIMMIKQRSKEFTYLPRIHVFNTYFYKFISESGYKRVQRFTRKGPDIFSFDYIIIPCNISGNHWTCGLVNFRLKRLEFYDSLSYNRQPKFFGLLRDYLKKESVDKRNVDLDMSDWIEYYPNDIPRQTNGYDCGVFACAFADYLSRDEAFDFDQSDLTYFRQRLTLEVCTGKFMARRGLSVY